MRTFLSQRCFWRQYNQAQCDKLGGGESSQAVWPRLELRPSQRLQHDHQWGLYSWKRRPFSFNHPSLPEWLGLWGRLQAHVDPHHLLDWQHSWLSSLGIHQWLVRSSLWHLIFRIYHITLLLPSFGRKPTVLLTHAVYVLAGAATLLAPNFTALLICRYCKHFISILELLLEGVILRWRTTLPSFGAKIFGGPIVEPSKDIGLWFIWLWMPSQVPSWLCAPHSQPFALPHRFSQCICICQCISYLPFFIGSVHSCTRTVLTPSLFHTFSRFYSMLLILPTFSTPFFFPIL